MQIYTRMIEDELYQASTEAGHEVTIDMRNPSVKKAQSPVELLLSAVASCSAVDVVAILKKRRKTVTAFEIITTGERNAVPPRYFKTIHLTFKVHSPDATVDELNKACALSIEKYCSVAASLRSVITFSAEIHM